MFTECDGCGTEYEVPDDKAGKKARCGKCGKRFVVGGEAKFVFNALEDESPEKTEVFGPQHESRRVFRKPPAAAATPPPAAASVPAPVAAPRAASPEKKSAIHAPPPMGEIIAMGIAAAVLLLGMGYCALRWNRAADKAEDLQKQLEEANQKNEALDKRAKDLGGQQSKTSAELETVSTAKEALEGGLKTAKETGEKLTADLSTLQAEHKKTKAGLAQATAELDAPLYFSDRFTADSVGPVWDVNAGEAKIQDGTLVLSAATNATAVCRLRLKGDFQIEYDAMIDKAIDPKGFSDLSCFLCADEKTPVQSGYFVGVGTNYNVRCRIARQGKDVAVKEGALLKEKVAYRVRVVWKGGTLQLYCRELSAPGAEAKESKEAMIVEYKDPEPLGKDGGCFGLYAFGAAARFDNVRVSPAP